MEHPPVCYPMLMVNPVGTLTAQHKKVLSANAKPTPPTTAGNKIYHGII
jgi:hypothetical protein